jgi:predicted PurR-regulated permease PerM
MSARTSAGPAARSRERERAIDAMPESDSSVRRVAIAAATAVGIAVAVVILWRTAGVAMIAFGGVLLAIVLRTLAGVFVRRLHLAESASLALAVALIAAALAAAGWLIGATLATELSGLVQQVPAALDKLRAWLSSQPAGRAILESFGDVDGLAPAARLAGVTITAFGAIAHGLLVLVLGVYLAIDPGQYRRGLLHLLPTRHRFAADRALSAAGSALHRWLRGQLIAMAIVGIATGVGLWALGVPFALSLGLLAGMLEFIAFIGPIAAAVPAILLGFGESPLTALYVALLYLVVQQVEAYVLMPLVQRWAVALPPALAILAVVVLGILIGLPGVLFAVPVVVAAIAIVESLRDAPAGVRA